ncbi:MAG: SHOCT domain-containing protein [Planctomycetota bacterium]
MIAALAQTTQNNGNPVDVLIWVGALIVLVILGGVGIMVLKQRLFAEPSASEESVGLMEELRRAHQRGELTDEQYKAARGKLLARATGSDITPASRPSMPTTKADKAIEDEPQPDQSKNETDAADDAGASDELP